MMVALEKVILAGPNAKERNEILAILKNSEAQNLVVLLKNINLGRHVKLYLNIKNKLINEK